MEKINIVKLLKDCPEGTKLYSLVHGEVELTRVGVEDIYCKLSYLNHEISFYSDGRWVKNKGECILFPSKENRDWSTFQRPFKDGDIVATLKGNQIFIFKENVVNIDNSFSGVCYCGYDIQENKLFKELRLLFSRHATEEEKQKLFDAIKANGYKWNPDTKTLDKLEVNKFDITTLKPFDKVLVRDTNEQKWTVDMFSFYDKTHIYPFVCIGHYVNQCIPYEGNEHLLSKTNDCDEYFKTWK